MKIISHKTACKNGLPDDEHMIFETCRRNKNWIKTETWKVCNLLIYVTQTVSQGTAKQTYK
jgi:hypothetical protein